MEGIGELGWAVEAQPFVLGKRNQASSSNSSIKCMLRYRWFILCLNGMPSINRRGSDHMVWVMKYRVSLMVLDETWLIPPTNQRNRAKQCSIQSQKDTLYF